MPDRPSKKKPLCWGKRKREEGIRKRKKPHWKPDRGQREDVEAKKKKRKNERRFTRICALALGLLTAIVCSQAGFLRFLLLYLHDGCRGGDPTQIVLLSLTINTCFLSSYCRGKRKRKEGIKKRKRPDWKSDKLQRREERRDYEKKRKMPDPHVLSVICHPFILQFVGCRSKPFQQNFLDSQS